MKTSDEIVDVSGCLIRNGLIYDMTDIFRGKDSEVDYRDLKRDRPIWSIGHSKITGRYYGSVDCCFYGMDDVGIECVWLR